MYTFKMSKWNPEINRSEEWTETRGVGTTLRIYYRDVRIMSDVWESSQTVDYWDEEFGCVKTCDWVVTAQVDATPEVLAKVKASIYQNALEIERARADKDARRIAKDSVVTVTRGKSNRGLTGPVVVVIERPYNMGYRSQVERKLGIALDDEKVMVQGKYGKVFENYKNIAWVWARNCDLVVVPAINMPEVEMRARDKAVGAFRIYKEAA